jgi:hypothetical protein
MPCLLLRCRDIEIARQGGFLMKYSCFNHVCGEEKIEDSDIRKGWGCIHQINMSLSSTDP